MKYIFLGLLVFFLFSCSIKYIETQATYEKISTGPGPEDMVLDTIDNRKRLIVSCSERRKKQPTHDEIWVVSLENQEAKILPRTNHPDSILFHPHGIDLIYDGKNSWLLVVNHEEKNKRHSILRYLVKENELMFDTIFWNPKYLKSPNDVYAESRDKFWVSNDASSRNNSLALLFKIKSGNIVHYNGNSFIRSTPRLAFPNGVIRLGNQLIVSTTRQNKIISYDLDSLGRTIRGSRKTVAKAPGWDNLSQVNDSILLCTAHIKPLKFLSHYKNSSHYSPVAVFVVNVKNHNAELLFYTNGSIISAGSTAIFFDGYLYISQVFDPFIAKISLAK